MKKLNNDHTDCTVPEIMLNNHCIEIAQIPISTFEFPLRHVFSCNILLNFHCTCISKSFSIFFSNFVYGDISQAVQDFKFRCSGLDFLHTGKYDFTIIVGKHQSALHYVAGDEGLLKVEFGTIRD